MDDKTSTLFEFESGLFCLDLGHDLALVGLDVGLGLGLIGLYSGLHSGHVSLYLGRVGFDVGL